MNCRYRLIRQRCGWHAAEWQNRFSLLLSGILYKVMDRAYDRESEKWFRVDDALRAKQGHTHTHTHTENSRFGIFLAYSVLFYAPIFYPLKNLYYNHNNINNNNPTFGCGSELRIAEEKLYFALKCSCGSGSGRPDHRVS